MFNIQMMNVKLFDFRHKNVECQTNFSAVLEMGLNKVPHKLFDCLQNNCTCIYLDIFIYILLRLLSCVLFCTYE